MTDRPLTTEEAEIISRMARRYDESGGSAGSREAAHHEFGQNFPENVVHITRAKAEQIPYHVRALMVLDRWLERVRSGDRRAAGLHMWGDAGGGKTVLASLLANEAASVAGLKPAFISCREMRRELRGLPSDRRRNHNDYVEAADPKNYPYLVIDDFGLEAGNVEAVELVRDILDMRVSACSFTVVTSNKTPQDFLRHLGNDRDISRASILADLHLNNLPDYRRAE